MGAGGVDRDDAADEAVTVARLVASAHPVGHVSIAIPHSRPLSRAIQCECTSARTLADGAPWGPAVGRSADGAWIEPADALS
ncbi:hypothetical protein MFU01_19140 [Myxococcus fulvus]|uniref:Uncharacterized protein n=1 Tax=Myxococcus fulvus TaxID=33 RepID=A0A511SZ55_MYXFU|nr:hypothetical protein MFU01_19140 [Myxococcus fulvus]